MFGEKLGPTDWVRGLTPPELTSGVGSVALDAAIFDAAMREVDEAVPKPAVAPNQSGVAGVDHWRKAYEAASTGWEKRTRDSASLLEVVLGHMMDEKIETVSINMVAADAEEANLFGELVTSGVQEMVDAHRFRRAKTAVANYHRTLYSARGAENSILAVIEAQTIEDNKDLTYYAQKWDSGILRTKRDEVMSGLVGINNQIEEILRRPINTDFVKDLIANQEVDISDVKCAYEILVRDSDIYLATKKTYQTLLQKRKNQLLERYVQEIENELKSVGTEIAKTSNY